MGRYTTLFLMFQLLQLNFYQRSRWQRNSSRFLTGFETNSKAIRFERNLSEFKRSFNPVCKEQTLDIEPKVFPFRAQRHSFFIVVIRSNRSGIRNRKWIDPMYLRPLKYSLWVSKVIFYCIFLYKLESLNFLKSQ